VQARAFISPYNNLTAGHALHLGNRDQHRLAVIEGFFDILLKRFASGGQGDLAPGSVE